MNEIIKIKMNKNNEPVINGRELHEFLEVKSKYSDWINRMLKLGFVENNDYLAVAQKKEAAQGNEFTQFEHIMKIDMAKEISMLQRNKKGKQARLYFIECEKRFRENRINKLTDTEILAKAILIANEELKRKDKLIEDQKQKIEEQETYLDIIRSSSNKVVTTQIAQDYGYSAKKFNQVLKEYGVHYKINGQWILTHKYKDCGYIMSETLKFNNRSIIHTNWTHKGREFLFYFLKERGVLPTFETEKNRLRVMD